jgi:hypothetical protein
MVYIDMCKKVAPYYFIDISHWYEYLFPQYRVQQVIIGSAMWGGDLVMESKNEPKLCPLSLRS